MAIKLVANYSKRLGLPGYWSHQFSVSVETELRDLTEADSEMANLYPIYFDERTGWVRRLGGLGPT